MACTIYILAPIAAIDATGWREEKYGIYDIQNESWILWVMGAMNVYNSIPYFSTGPLSGTTPYFQSALLELLNQGDLSTGEEIETAGLALDISEKLYVSKEIWDNLNNKNFSFKDISCEVVDYTGNVLHVSEELWRLCQLLMGSESVYKAIDLLSEYGNGALWRAAHLTKLKISNVKDGNLGVALLTEFLDYDGAKTLLEDGVGSVAMVHAFYSKVLNGVLTYSSEAPKEIEALSLFLALVKTQEAILNICDELESTDFVSEEEYIEAYRALAYTYVLCSQEGYAALEGTDLIRDFQTYKVVRETLTVLLQNILTASFTANGEDTATISHMAFPNVLSREDTFVSFGLVEKKTGLESIRIDIVDNETGIVCDCAYSENLSGKKSYQILELDSQLDYDKLGAGSYSLQVYEGETLIYQSNFIVKAEDGLFTVNAYKLPKPQAWKATFPLKGYVKSRYSLSSVKVAVVGQEGDVKTGGIYSVAGTIFYLSSVDAQLEFNKLDVCTADQLYYFIVEATDVYGNKEILICQPFYVY